MSAASSERKSEILVHGGVISFFGEQNPFEPPDHVKSLLRPGDWEALSRVWSEVEEQAMRWADNEEDSDEMAEDSKSPPAKGVPRKRRPWNQDFKLGSDHKRRPARLRRYFDPAHNEGTPWCPAADEALEARLTARLFGQPTQREAQDMHEAMHPKPWLNSFQNTVDVDNDRLNPMLRHYFDTRGIEASFRTRPHLSKVEWRTKTRTPRRPSTRERVLKFSISEPSLASKSSTRSREEVCPPSLDTEARHSGSITWGRRCLQYGRPGAEKEQSTSQMQGKIPWVHDHHVSMATDNEILNPRLRHYFQEEGLEASFRNRGHHYGRKGYRPAAFYGPSAVDERSRLNLYGRGPDLQPL